jgi:hypothetical protein
LALTIIVCCFLTSMTPLVCKHLPRHHARVRSS